MFQPLGVFLIRQQIQDFPQETLEAARLDGASEYRIYRSIVKPNLSSAIAAALILIFIDIEICSLMFYTIFTVQIVYTYSIFYEQFNCIKSNLIVYICIYNS